MKKHLDANLSTQAWGRRALSAFLGLSSYWGALTLVTESTTWPEFAKIIGSPFAILGAIGILASTLLTSGKK